MLFGRILSSLAPQCSDPEIFFFFNLEGFANDYLIYFFHLLADLIKINSFPWKRCLSYSLKSSQLQQYYYCEQSCLHFNESNCVEFKRNQPCNHLKITQMHFYAEKVIALKSRVFSGLVSPLCSWELPFPNSMRLLFLPLQNQQALKMREFLLYRVFMSRKASLAQG